jgi:3-oxoacyl-[acyl-carrier-protein] synthase II
MLSYCALDMGCARDIVVTGTGLLTAAGGDVAATWEKVLAGDTSAIRPHPAFAGEEFPSKLAGSLDEWDPREHFGRKELRDMDRVVKVALFAAEQAVRDAGLEPGALDEERFGVVFGTGFGGLRTTSHWVEEVARDPGTRVSPLAIPLGMPNAGAYHLARRYRALGPTRTVSTACSSSALAVAAALDQLRAGRADAMLVAGADVAAFPGIIRSWRGLRVMTLENELEGGAYKPFDVSRAGFVMGEGAAALVLETRAHAEARGVPTCGEVLGYGNNLDGGGIAAPSAPRQVACLRAALQDAGLEAGEVGFVAVHGSGTILNDPVEAEALHEVLGPTLVQDAKPVFGHLMGASGLAEVVLALESLGRGLVPSIPNLRELDPACPVRPPAEGGEAPPAPVCLVDSFGFGGTNVTLALRRTAETGAAS